MNSAKGRDVRRGEKSSASTQRTNIGSQNVTTTKPSVAEAFALIGAPKPERAAENATAALTRNSFKSTKVAMRAAAELVEENLHRGGASNAKGINPDKKMNGTPLLEAILPAPDAMSSERESEVEEAHCRLSTDEDDANRDSSGGHRSKKFQHVRYEDGRGKYDRLGETVQKRLSLAQLAWNHHIAVDTMGIKTCSPGCPLGGRCFKSLSANDLLACHNESFGTSLTWDEKRNRPKLLQKTNETQTKWRALMNSIFHFDGDGKLLGANHFTVANIRVCAECMRQSYAIPLSTWNRYMTIGKRCPRALEMHGALADLERFEHQERKANKQHLTKYGIALNWWLDWLSW